MTKGALVGIHSAMFTLDRSGPTGWLRLNRPQARNAVPLDGWNQLRELAEEVTRTPLRALVVTGEGGAFCGGADLKDLAKLVEDADRRGRFRQEMRAALKALADLQIPVIAAIDGPCHGAGVALAMACDIRIAGDTARVSLPPARLGISYPQADIDRLVALVGPGQASRLLLTAVTIDADEARAIGLVEERAASAAEAAKAMGEAIGELAGPSLARLKRAIAGQEELFGDRAFDRALGEPEFAKRLAALK